MCGQAFGCDVDMQRRDRRGVACPAAADEKIRRLCVPKGALCALVYFGGRMVSEPQNLLDIESVSKKIQSDFNVSHTLCRIILDVSR